MCQMDFTVVAGILPVSVLLFMHTGSHTSHTNTHPQALVTKALSSSLQGNSKSNVNITAVFPCPHCLVTLMCFFPMGGVKIRCQIRKKRRKVCELR